MNERTLGCALGEEHPDTTRITLITQCDPKITYHPPVQNRFSDRFQPAVETIHSICSETIIRVVERDRTARLAYGLKVAPASPPTFFTRQIARLVGFQNIHWDRRQSRSAEET
ncbi:MAG TPA: hypothetical protein VLE19_14225 [Pyrinomonadaceae bacterium]|nr:hypothetical protein [Pyrinomonadaceae bacterium]